MKICRKCKVEKELDEFYKDKISKDAHTNRCIECEKKRRIIYYQKNKDKEQRKRLERYYKNKQNELDYKTNRYNTNAEYRLTEIIRKRSTKAIKYHSLTKQYSTMEYLGCDQRTLLEWLQWSGERYDPNFNINEYDGNEYHIDHIKTFADVEKGIYTLEEVAHYTNLQILTAEENLSKGGTSWIE